MEGQETTIKATIFEDEADKESNIKVSVAKDVVKEKLKSSMWRRLRFW